MHNAAFDTQGGNCDSGQRELPKRTRLSAPAAGGQRAPWMTVRLGMDRQVLAGNGYQDLPVAALTQFRYAPHSSHRRCTWGNGSFRPEAVIESS